MKVYFGAAASQLDEFKHKYQKIMEIIAAEGHKVLTTHDVLHTNAQMMYQDDSLAFKQVYKRWQMVVSQTDIAVVEASYPSTVIVGSGIFSLVERGKPTVVLYVHGRDPIFIDEIISSRLIKVEYSLKTLPEVLPWALDEAKQWLERRFTMIIPGEIDAHLEKISKLKQISRSEYIRSLIEKDMKRE